MGSGPSEQSEGAGAPDLENWIAEYLAGQTEVGTIAARCMAASIVERVLDVQDRIARHGPNEKDGAVVKLPNET